jgi:tRNA nucleotidyltransferase (CCA-adding enzyme)
VAGVRLFSELSLALQEARPFPILARLEGLGVLAAIHPRLALTPETAQRFRAAGEVLTWYDLLYLEEPAAAWLVYCLVLLEQRKAPQARAILRRLSPPPRTATLLAESLHRLRGLVRTLGPRQSLAASQVHRWLAGASLEVVLALMARLEAPVLRKAIGDYLGQTRRVKPMLTGDDLRSLGLRPGPIYRDILTALLYARLDGEVQSRDDELRFVRRRFARAFDEPARGRRE